MSPAGPGRAATSRAWPLACSTLAYAESSIERALSGIAAGGFRFVEIAAMPGYCDHLVAPGEGEAATVRRIAGLLESSSLSLVSLSAHIDLVPAPPGHLPGFSAEEALAMLLARVRLAAALGASVVNTQGAWPQSAEDHARFLERIMIVADAADGLGVTLALETADGLTASAESILALMDELAGVPLAINFDTGNLPFYSGLDPLAELGPIHRFVRHVHLKDHRGPMGSYDFPAIGDGRLDLAAFVTALAGYGFAGPISAEIEFQHPVRRPDSAEVDAAVARSLAAMRAYVAGVA